LNETYHSTYGAVQESRHVFIDKGLKFLLQREADSFDVLEIGFGTGLNALLTIEAAEASNVNIRYTTIDNFPLQEEIWKHLHYSESASAEDVFRSLHETSWDESHLITKHFELRKINTSIHDVELKGDEFDIVYFDAFAPNKQPEMWEQQVLEKMYRALKPNGLFLTYCAKGQVKRDLRAIGFEVETLDGPPGKKEMIRAVKP
jgi:tRNA U34 5-methylaminomethyl-2-thiouridine-forming methyltransferase MnmC